MMRKTILAGLGAAVVGLATAGGLTGCVPNKPSAPERTQLVMGLEDTFAPMGFVDETGEFAGYDVELAREVCHRRGWTLCLKAINWRAKEELLRSGQIDCIWNGLTITDDRLERMVFTPGYLRNEQVLVVREDSPYHRLKDLKGKVVAVQDESSALQALKDSPELHDTLKDVVARKDAAEALASLGDGTVDAVVIDLMVANDSIRRSGQPFRILDEGLAPEEYGIGFRLGDEALAEEVWKTLLEMAADGTVTRISEKWFGCDISIIPVLFGRGRRH